MSQQVSWPHDDFVFLDSFEGEGGYVYRKESGSVVEPKIFNDGNSRKEVEFNDFLRYFFDIA